ncbi:hypothetical protein [Nocardioides mangrovi]|uniref:Secreted protein n=1 Tax=Nocardioides mangrovi TaxID=2874580 RepID=A0ABS7UGY6_9ACTN|nr:hypothetical protein [Nocardioides mangrovi]MBZ5739941.1 hypothetical protein [Nocardioides mangrovi]
MPRTLAVAIAALALVWVPSAAAARPWTGADAKDDVQVTPAGPNDACPTDETASSEHTATGDLRALGVRRERDRVVATLRFADDSTWVRRTVDVHLRTASGTRDLYAYQPAPATGFDLTVRHLLWWDQEDVDEDGDGETDCQQWVGYTELVWCEGLVVDPVGRTLTLSVPRSCLGKGHWVKAGADTFGTDDEADGVRLADQWGTQSVDDDPRDVVYGPRVRIRG